MKRISLVFGIISAVSFLLPGSSSQAYFLDSPHNESNGIECTDCHNGDEWDISDPNLGTGDIDVTLANVVCLRCHGEGSTNTLKGPAKKLHASSTTSTDLGDWSTSCTDCHDGHFQPQMMWASDPDFVLANFAYDNHSGLDPITHILGTHDGTTTFGISGVVGSAPYNDPTLWNSKGGRIDKTRAEDNSRGLLVVSNYPTLVASDTFEIIDVLNQGGGNYVVTVKGDMTSANVVARLGVIYGQSIKSQVKDLGAGYNRNVKFFKPEIITDQDGGYIDKHPDTKSSTPVGLCQVCHSVTAFWDTLGVEHPGQSHQSQNGECCSGYSVTYCYNDVVCT